ncbi:Rieske (2Fe-2S) protein [Hymenobacter algoricola]|uniref:Rieske domain-containing protein n=1 Tax=Hymenobacter algoricola TaxID=486267 RepID=A0ABP7NRF2_9BACT
MERKEFIHLFGMGAAAVLASGCLGGCASKDPDPAPGPPPVVTQVDFTLDLMAPENAALHDPARGYVYGANKQVIVVKTAAGGYAALQAPCPHQGTTIVFESGPSQFVCPNHGSVFTLDGTVVTGPANRALRRYTATQTGNLLRVTS